MSKLLTTKQAAEMIGYSEYMLRRSRSKNSKKLAGTNPPPHIKIGRTVRYSEDDIVAWIESLKLGAEH